MGTGGRGRGFSGVLALVSKLWATPFAGPGGAEVVHGEAVDIVAHEDGGFVAGVGESRWTSVSYV